MNARIFAAAFATVAMAVLWSLTQRHNTSVEARMRETETGVPAWDASTAKDAVAKANDSWHAAMQAVAAREPKEAFDAYHRAVRGDAAFLVKNHPDKEAGPGQTLRQWFDERDKAFRDAFLPQMDWILDSLAKGDLSSGEVKQLVQNLAYVDFKEPEQRFKKEEKRIAEERAKAATRWLRVELQHNVDTYEGVVKEALRTKWNDRYGFKVVFGYPLSDAERQATWKTLTVDLNQQDAHYKGSNQKTAFLSGLSVPESVGLRFKLAGPDPVLTSWDSLAPLSVSVEVPASLWVKYDRYSDDKPATLQAEARRVGEEKKKELVAALRQQLKGLPGFTLFPGVNPATLSLLKGDRLDNQAATALAYLEPDRLKSEAVRLTQSNNPRLREDLLGLAISTELEPLAAWVTKNLPLADRQTQSRLARELGRKPWYGNFEPLLAVIVAATNDYPQEAVQALRGHVQHRRVQEVLAQKAAVSRDYQRGNYAHLFLSEAPWEAVDARARQWVTDKDGNFAAQAYTALLNRDRARATALMLEVFEQASPRAQAVMLQQFTFSPERHGDREMSLLLRMARQKTNREAKAEARSAIRKVAYTAAGWQAYSALAKEEADPRQKHFMEEELLHSVHRALPDRAEAYRLEKLRGTNALLRDFALFDLLSTDDPKDAVLRELAQLIATRPQDSTLLPKSVAAIRQYHTLRRNWDFSEGQQDLKTILELGSRHAEARVRRDAQEVIAYAVKKGHAHYASLLQGAQASASPRAPAQTAARQ
jgi:hypothetical protein